MPALGWHRCFCARGSPSRQACSYARAAHQVGKHALMRARLTKSASILLCARGSPSRQACSYARAAHQVGKHTLMRARLTKSASMLLCARGSPSRQACSCARAAHQVCKYARVRAVYRKSASMRVYVSFKCHPARFSLTPALRCTTCASARSISSRNPPKYTLREASAVVLR